MARRRDKVTIEREGRDKGKVFWITEMSATEGEYWAGRMLTLLAAGNTQVPSGFFQMGFEGCAAWIAVHGIGGIDWTVAKPLLDEMMACVTIQPDPTRNITRALLDDDIEEITTRLALREAWFDTHLGFSVRARFWTSTTAPSAPSNPNGQNIATFPTNVPVAQSAR
jgi:hypothetical protein